MPERRLFGLDSLKFLPRVHSATYWLHEHLNDTNVIRLSRRALENCSACWDLKTHDDGPNRCVACSFQFQVHNPHALTFFFWLLALATLTHAYNIHGHGHYYILITVFPGLPWWTLSRTVSRRLKNSDRAVRAWEAVRSTLANSYMKREIKDLFSLGILSHSWLVWGNSTWQNFGPGDFGWELSCSHTSFQVHWNQGFSALQNSPGASLWLDVSCPSNWTHWKIQFDDYIM